MTHTTTSRKSIKLSAYETLMTPHSPWIKNPEQRAKMTLACKDAKDIPRVANAGQSKRMKGLDVQIMHNGLMVKKNGYQGEWQSKIIEGLKGVHEPQEEKVFHEVVKRLAPGAVIMELGAWWAYYSMWVTKAVPRGKAICCEPDLTNLELGKANAEINGFRVGEDMVFYHSAAGSKDGKQLVFTNEDGSRNKVVIRTVDSLVKELGINSVDVLHMDIQGAEIDALKGAQESIKYKKIRFVFISTHHYSISHDANIHQKCIDFIKSNGGTIVTQHTVLESCSGDGLVVGSFSEEDKNFTVDVSHQSSNDSLFRSHEQDLEVLWHSYDKLGSYVTALEGILEETRRELQWKSEHIDHLEKTLAEIGPLKQHIKRQVKLKLNSVKTKSKDRN